MKFLNVFSKPKYMVNTVYLSRHGQSVYNTENRIGGDSKLSNHGLTYPKKLFKFIKEGEQILIRIFKRNKCWRF